MCGETKKKTKWGAGEQLKRDRGKKEGKQMEWWFSFKRVDHCCCQSEFLRRFNFLLYLVEFSFFAWKI